MKTSQSQEGVKAEPIFTRQMLVRLILPLLTFLYALVMALSAAAYNGGIPRGPILASLILGNIPTVILLAIYAACREKFHKRSELDKMQIKDL